MFHQKQVTDMPTSAELDAKIAASEARTDTKFAEFMGELRLSTSKMTQVENDLRETRSAISGVRTTVIVTAVGSVIAIAGLFYSALQYGSGMFGVGMNAQTISDQSAKNAIELTQPKLDAVQAQYTDLNSKVDTVIQYLQAQQNGDKSRALPQPEILPKNP
jgi:hypothetical protein